LAGAAVLFTRNRLTWLAGATILFCWTMAPGDHSPFYLIAKKLFPPIGIARFPIKFVILPAFLLPLLAARGFAQFITAPGKNSSRRLLTVAGVMIVFIGGLLWFAKQYPFPLDDWTATATNAALRIGFLAGIVGGLLLLSNAKNTSAQTVALLVILILLPLDALTHSPKIAPTLPASVLAPNLWQASRRPASPALGNGRVMISPDAEHQLLYSRVPDFQSDLVGKRLAEWYNFNLLDRIPKVNGAITLRPAHFDILERSLYYTAGGHCGRGLVDFLSVTWLSAPDNPTQWQMRTNVLPLITAGQKPVFMDDPSALATITAENFDPRTTVCLPANESVSVTGQSDCPVTNIHIRLNEVDADITASTAALAVISQSYYHLWRAEIDGKTARLIRANLAFQAVEVPSGTHHLHLVYRDPRLKTGAIISLLSLAICVVLWLRRQERPAETTRPN